MVSLKVTHGLESAILTVGPMSLSGRICSIFTLALAAASKRLQGIQTGSLITFTNGPNPTHLDLLQHANPVLGERACLLPLRLEPDYFAHGPMAKHEAMKLLRLFGHSGLITSGAGHLE